MCLDVVFVGDEKQRAIDALPERFYVWKKIYRNSLTGECHPTVRRDREPKPLRSGQMEASYQGPPYDGYKKESRYNAGWHAFRTRKSLEKYAVWGGEPTVHYPWVRCRAKKCHIVAIGTQKRELCVVLSHITFPKSIDDRKSKALERL